VSMARDLHDGALHSLAGVALQLEVLLRTGREISPAARQRLLDIQHGLVAEQRNLRLLVDHLKAAEPSLPDAVVDLASRLQDLAAQLIRQWGLRVECKLDGLDRIPSRLSYEIYLVVREALINIVRHANASAARLEVASRNRDVTIGVADNGRGFAFKGRYDHATLFERQLGPATLRERVALLSGTLSIESTEAGSRLEITLPIGPPAE
jgi:signal transduction histidine kinase